MSMPIILDGQAITINFELQCDAFSGAYVGISIRDNEDSAFSGTRSLIYLTAT